ncbi:MAG: hypothetical protein ACK56F_08265, partial [bacterium]
GRPEPSTDPAPGNDSIEQFGALFTGRLITNSAPPRHYESAVNVGGATRRRQTANLASASIPFRYAAHHIPGIHASILIKPSRSPPPIATPESIGVRPLAPKPVAPAGTTDKRAPLPDHPDRNATFPRQSTCRELVTYWLVPHREPSTAAVATFRLPIRGRQPVLVPILDGCRTVPALEKSYRRDRPPLTSPSNRQGLVDYYRNNPSISHSPSP